jgi:hypothetical protein
MHSTKIPTCSLRYFCLILMKVNFLDTLLKHTQISNVMEIHPVGTKLFHADGQTDIMKLFLQIL